MKRILLIGALAVATAAQAQTYRVSAGVGYGTGNLLNHTLSKSDPIGTPVFFISAGRKIAKRLEAGIAVHVQKLAAKSVGTTSSGTMTTYLNYGKPAILPMVFLNGVVPVAKGSAYFGVNSGAVFTVGSKNSGNPYNPGPTPEPTEWQAGYKSSTGFTAGIQAGYRHPISKRLDLGIGGFYSVGRLTLKPEGGKEGSAWYYMTGGTINVGYRL